VVLAFVGLARPAHAGLGDHFLSHPIDYSATVGATFGWIGMRYLRTHKTPLIDRSAELPFLEAERVPTWAVGAGLIVSGAGVIGGLSALDGGDVPPSNMALSYAGTLVATMLLTEVSKVAISRERPDYADRLKRGLDDDLLNDGRKSFWSGHSSMSFASATFLSLQLADFALDDGRSLGTAALLWGGATVLITSAGLVANSRLDDGRHHLSDVLVGAVVGTFIGTLGYIRSRIISSDERDQTPFSKQSESPKRFMLSTGGVF
jgi:diacylglycerol diphosphate phosphatase/phosphatidate phosphatase